MSYVITIEQNIDTLFCQGTNGDWEVALGVKIQGDSDLKHTEVEAATLSRSKLSEHSKSYTGMKRCDITIKMRTFKLDPDTLAEHNRNFPMRALGRKRKLVEYEFQTYDFSCKRQCFHSHEVEVFVSDGDCGDSCLGCHVCHKQKTIEDEVDEEDTCQSRPVIRKFNAKVLGVHVPGDNVHPADRRNAEVL